MKKTSCDNCSNGPGFLEIGTSGKGEIIINLPKDMTGHIIFSLEETISLVAVLNRMIVRGEEEFKNHPV